MSDKYALVHAANCAIEVLNPGDLEEAGPLVEDPASYAVVLGDPEDEAPAVEGSPEQLLEFAARITATLRAAFPELASGPADVLDQAGGLVENGLRLGERDTDLFRIFAHAALMLARNPHVTLDEVLDDGFPGGAAAVRRWWTSWT